MLVDRLQIELVLRNLLANAFEAVQEQPPGARRITVAGVKVAAVAGKAGKPGPGAKGRQASERRDCLHLVIEDSGKGVSQALAARLFEPFVSSKASGLGLGLVLSRAIMEAHGGALWAEVGDKGIFKMALPLARAEEPEHHVAA